LTHKHKTVGTSAAAAAARSNTSSSWAAAAGAGASGNVSDEIVFCVRPIVRQSATGPTDRASERATGGISVPHARPDVEPVNVRPTYGTFRFAEMRPRQRRGQKLLHGSHGGAPELDMGPFFPDPIQSNPWMDPIHVPLCGTPDW